MSKHGGSRQGAGRPSTPIEESRVVSLRKQGYSMMTIANRLGTTEAVIKYRINKLKQSGKL